MPKRVFACFCFLLIHVACSQAQGGVKAFIKSVLGLAPSDSTASKQEPASLSERYEPIYNLLHAQDSLRLGKDQLGAAAPAKISQYRLHPGLEVFGWHPYWMDTAYLAYNFNLLSTLAFFSYDIDPITGLPKNGEAIRLWNTTPMVDSAKAYRCKVLLTITNHGAGNNRMFLDSPAAQAQLIDTLSGLLANRQADGVDVNFEVVPKSHRGKFSAFVARLADGLRRKLPGCLINITLPCKSQGAAFDVAQLGRYANSFVMMGYDYSGPVSAAGPIAPLYLRSGKKGADDLAQSVQHYLAQGMEAGRLILALPYYGGLWSGQAGGKGTTGFNQFERHLTYGQIRRMVSMNGGEPLLDAGSNSMIYTYAGKDSLLYQIWFDDSTSLRRKFDWAAGLGLGGIGIWALGFDHGYAELWQTIAATYAAPDLPVARPALTITGFILQHRRVLVANLLFLLTFMMLGFVVALFNWKIREKLFFSRTYRLVFICLFFLFGTALISLYDLRWERNFAFGAGLALGALVTFGVITLAERARRAMPRS